MMDQVMHNLKTPNFSTLICYDRIFCDITYTVTSCTENEANRYGRFLCAMLETVMHWHSSKKIFDDECANYPGFVTKFRVGNQPSETNDHVDFENYRHVVHKWHHKIAKALVVCLESKDYVQIRNALIVLIRILPYFPVIIPLGSVLFNYFILFLEFHWSREIFYFFLIFKFLSLPKNASRHRNDFDIIRCMFKLRIFCPNFNFLFIFLL